MVVQCSECGEDVQVVSNAQKAVISKGLSLCCRPPRPCAKKRKLRKGRERYAQNSLLDRRVVCGVCGQRVIDPTRQQIAAYNRAHGFVTCSAACRSQRVRDKDRARHKVKRCKERADIKIACEICGDQITNLSRGQWSTYGKGYPVTCGQKCAKALRAPKELAKYRAKIAMAEQQEREAWRSHVVVTTFVPAGAPHPNSILGCPF